jgi:hypothetical protein
MFIGARLFPPRTKLDQDSLAPWFQYDEIFRGLAVTSFFGLIKQVEIQNPEF